MWMAHLFDVKTVNKYMVLKFGKFGLIQLKMIQIVQG